MRINKIAVTSVKPKPVFLLPPVQEKFHGQEEPADQRLGQRRSSTLEMYRGLIDREETADLCDLLGMTYSDIHKLNNQFAEEDTDNTYALAWPVAVVVSLTNSVLSIGTPSRSNRSSL